MSILVDTSVWSLALRRDTPERTREVEALTGALEAGEVVLIGCVLQELLQGFPARERTQRL
ncbi:MAG TPA: PIN domain nuclease, partial [Vicinamibacteria bacterium]|nr:PIN domain nuclease [Vicinamibacteria bacterium]